MIKTMLSDGTAIATMPGKGKDLRPKSGKDAPGPGAYDPKVNYSRKSDPNFSMSKTTRDAALGLYTQTPAPGTYFVSDGLVRTHSASWRIGTEGRPK